MTVRVRRPRESISPELRELLDGIEGLPCDASRKQMLRVVRRLAGRRLYITRVDLVAPDRLALALELLKTMGVRDTCVALQVRLVCTERTAYRLITAALQVRSGVVPATKPCPAGYRQLAMVLDE